VQAVVLVDVDAIVAVAQREHHTGWQASCRIGWYDGIHDIANLVEDEQKPGSFGDLIKRSVELAGAHNEFQGSNVVSMIGRQFTK